MALRLVTCVLITGLAALVTPARASAEAMDFTELAARCAPQVHPQTLAAVVGHESGFNPLAIGVNGVPTTRVRAQTAEEAIRLSEQLIAQGRNIDMGLGQINSANLKWLGLSVRQVFDPCTNLTAAARVLVGNYRSQAGKQADTQRALDAALSQYNTGDPKRGLANGYVGKVRRRAGLPAGSVMVEIAQQPAPAPWDAFGHTARPERATAAEVMPQSSRTGSKTFVEQGVHGFGRSL
ncbi:lytic transglycosylase domain-containing protein [Xanthomonas euvesicatoria]|uniref:lytic transglycosylase domain-containing protein n=1 Tax=Xanthomonas euvesicatoria TaxID=456327 RepID=UPI003D2F74A1